MTELEFIKRSLDWPNWPVLPMVKRNDPLRACGLLVDDGMPQVVLGANIWRMNEIPGTTWGEKLSGFERKLYGSFEELLTEWRID